MKALKDKEYKELKEELDMCQNPLYFFHDDPDGLCSFLLFYKYKREGNGVVIKSTPLIDLKYLKKVEEYNPDKIFVLDIADVSQEFIDSVNVPIIWFDHHGPYQRRNIKYFNPRLHNKDNNPPVSYMAYFVVEENKWISLAGMVADWYLPKKTMRNKLSQEFPDLLPMHVDDPAEALFNTRLGKLCKILSFILKGTYRDAMKYVKILTRINSPEEILNCETKQAEFVYKKYEKINAMYESLLEDAKKKVTDNLFLEFYYSEDTTSFTGDIANELLYLYPEKIILIAREKSGEMKCSLRAAKYDLPSMIDQSISGLEGAYGGGHKNASGAVIKKDDFDFFLKKMKIEAKKQSKET
ncbi:MAG: DHHA1 domain-containing protein [Nanobdellota archaeon]